MIYPINGLPCLMGVDGELVEINIKTIRYSLLLAASKAGYSDWWLGEQVLQGILVYLRDEYLMNCISVCELEKLLKS